jgi:hypothetical protein
MNFLKNQRYKYFAAIASALIHVLLVVVLVFGNKFGELQQPVADTAKDEKSEAFTQIQDNLPEENTTPSAPKVLTEDDKKQKSDLPKQKENSKIIEQPRITQNIVNQQGDVPLEEKKDTVLKKLEKKTVAELQTPASPSETKLKQTIKQPDYKKDTVYPNQNRYRDDRQFVYNNYRTIRNMKRVYPYAKKTKQVVDDLNRQLVTMTDERAKKALINKTQKELFQTFEKDIRSMTVSQGKILLKLISRETDKSAYTLIKEYKGTIPAVFWQGVGRLFGENLKSEYDSTGEDKVLEQIIQKYERGDL